MSDFIFSIIVPVYNAQKILQKNLSNIYFDRADVQYVFVNDGSKDRSGELLLDFCNSHNNAYLYDIQHRGVSNARNFGVEHATGQYILFCDVDDKYSSDLFSVLTEKIVSQNDMIIFGAYINNLDNRYFMSDIEPNNCVYENADVMKSFYKERGAFPYVWNCCYKRDFIINNKLQFNECLNLGEDLAFQFESFMVAKKIRFISDKLYVYNFCTDSSCNGYYLNHPTERIKKHLNLVDEIYTLFEKRNVTCDDMFANWVLNFLFRDVINLNSAERKEIDQHIRTSFKKMQIKRIARGLKNKLKVLILTNRMCQNTFCLIKRHLLK